MDKLGPRYDEWEGISDDIIELYQLYQYVCPLSNIEVLIHTLPCHYSQCSHHVISEDMHYPNPHETEATHNFYNCIYLIDEHTKMTQVEIAEATGLHRRGVQEIELRAIRKASKMAKKKWPERYKEGRRRASNGNGGSGNGDEPLNDNPITEGETLWQLESPNQISTIS